MMIRLVCVLGGDVAVAPQMIEHYRRLGVQSFMLIRHAERQTDPGFVAVEQAVHAAGLSLYQTHVGPWHEDLNAILTERVMSRHPDDWFVVADADELHVFDRPLPELLTWCDALGYDVVEGCFLDRVAADGGFPEVTPDVLWNQFPLAGALSFPLLGATPTKVVAARGRVRLDLGHHSAKDGRITPHRQVYAQVHHFKWNDSVVERTRIRKSRVQAGQWRWSPSMLSETLRLLDHVAAHGGRIDVAEPVFMFRPCGSGYYDHPQWAEMVRWIHQHWPAGW